MLPQTSIIHRVEKEEKVKIKKSCRLMISVRY